MVRNGADLVRFEVVLQPGDLAVKRVAALKCASLEPVRQGDPLLPALPVYSRRQREASVLCLRDGCQRLGLAVQPAESGQRK